MSLLSVVIPTSGNPERLDRTLGGLTVAYQSRPLFEVIVSDDGTDDRTSEVVAKWSNRLDVHCARTNAGRGAAYARNRGIEIANGDRVLFLDDDCVPTPEVIWAHTRDAYRAHKNAGRMGLRRMVAPEYADMLEGGDFSKVPFTDEVRTVTARLAWGRPHGLGLHKFAFTCHISYPVGPLRAVGGFWEEFRGAGFEDLELALRITRFGVRLIPLSGVFVYHQNHPQSHHQTDNRDHNKALYLQTVRDTWVTRHTGPLQ